VIKDRKIQLVKSLKIVRPADGLRRWVWTMQVAEPTDEWAVTDASRAGGKKRSKRPVEKGSVDKAEEIEAKRKKQRY
jgi:hypothetical protein